MDEAAFEVRVNSVSPGNIYTPLWQEAIDAAPDPAKTRADGDAAQLLGRMGIHRGVGAALPVPGRRGHLHHRR